MRWVGDRLHPEQFAYAYAWKTLMQSGIHVAGGSDAPVEHPSPFIGLHDAIFRTNARKPGVSEKDRTVFRPEECLTLDEALWIYTVEGAYAAGYENILGKISPHYIADLVVVNPACLDQPELLFDLKPDMVFVGGNVVATNATGESHVMPVVVKGGTELDGSSQGKDFEQTLDGPFAPGKGGNMTTFRKQRRKLPDNCQVVGFCTCFLSKEYCF